MKICVANTPCPVKSHLKSIFLRRCPLSLWLLSRSPPGISRVSPCLAATPIPSAIIVPSVDAVAVEVSLLLFFWVGGLGSGRGRGRGWGWGWGR